MGKVIMSGIVPTLTKPMTGILASDLAVGSTVKLMEDGTAVEYLVVNQGIPNDSSLYDVGCDGTWLLRKDIHSTMAFDSSGSTYWDKSSVRTYLNGTFFNLFDSATQSLIKQVKIPYSSSLSTVKSGDNGDSVKVFLLSLIELGITDIDSNTEGAQLPYFDAKTKRVAYLNGTAKGWWTRSLDKTDSDDHWYILTSGGYAVNAPGASFGIRPALILPSNALFDKATLILKGVA